jgi:hypothetical protein
MPRFDGKTEFVKAARARVADARALLDASKRQSAALSHTQGAKYIAGYAIECILKAYLVDSLGTNTLTEAVAELRGRERRAENPRLVPDLVSAAGHNLRLILSFTDLEAFTTPPFDIARDWGVCFQWQSSWRYVPKTPSLEDAESFVDSVEVVYNWIRSKM